MSRTAFDRVRRGADVHGSRPFVTTCDEAISYRTVADRASAYAAAFVKGRSADDWPVVGLYLDNRPEFVYAVLGAMRVGVTVACINTGMRGEALAHLLERASVTTVLSDDEQLAEVGDTCRESGAELRSVTTDSAFEPFDPGRSESVADRRPVGDGPALLLHTSGSTGLPKWCAISHEYLRRLGDYVASRFDIAGTDTVFTPLPLYHVNPFGYAFCGALSAGATLGLASSFSVSRFWDQVRARDATVVVLHMAPKNMIAERTTAEDAAGHGIRVMFPADREWMRRFDVPKTVTGYGSTEAGGLTHTNTFTRVPPDRDGEPLSRYAGYPRRDVSVRIADEDGRAVRRGDHGEILVRPEEPGAIFDGYHDDPQQTVDAWQGLWFNTGDVGYLDEDGALHFVGRAADSISHKGEFVNVSLVESALESVPGVERAVVVGVPDEVVGERVKACLRTTGALDPATVVERVEFDLPTFMVPEFVEFVESFPRLEGTEKIDRAALVERGVGDAWRAE